MTPRIPYPQSGDARTSSHSAPIATSSPPIPRWRSARLSFGYGDDLSGAPPHCPPVLAHPSRRAPIRYRIRYAAFTLPIAGALCGAFWAAMVASIIGPQWWLLAPIVGGAVYGHLAQESAG